jgi:hypothetical protein
MEDIYILSHKNKIVKFIKEKKEIRNKISKCSNKILFPLEYIDFIIKNFENKIIFINLLKKYNKNILRARKLQKSFNKLQKWGFLYNSKRLWINSINYILRLYCDNRKRIIENIPMDLDFIIKYKIIKFMSVDKNFDNYIGYLNFNLNLNLNLYTNLTIEQIKDFLTCDIYDVDQQEYISYNFDLDKSDINSN